MHRNRIRQHRDRVGLSQDDLAPQIGMTQPNLSRLEQGKQELTEDLMVRIAAALGVHPLDLLPIAVVAGLKSDIVREPMKAAPGIVAVLKAKGLFSYRILSDSLSGFGLKPGDTVIVDTTRTDISQLVAGDLVAAVVRSANPKSDDGSSYLVLRQFISPGGMLATNRPGTNYLFRLDEEAIRLEIVGVVEPGNGNGGLDP